MWKETVSYLLSVLPAREKNYKLVPKKQNKVNKLKGLQVLWKILYTNIQQKENKIKDCIYKLKSQHIMSSKNDNYRLVTIAHFKVKFI